METTPNKQQRLLDLLNHIEVDNCIITVSGQNDFLPAVFRQDQKYQIYLHEFSEFKEYDDVSDLITEIMKYSNYEDFVEYKLVPCTEFYGMRLQSIKTDIKNRIENINVPENTSLKDIISNVERDIATYVISNGEVKYLVCAVSTDEDWYYMYLVVDGLELKVEFSTCVGHYIPLHRYLPEEEYQKVINYTISKAIEDKNISTTSHWFCNKFHTTEFVPFTNVSIRKGIFWKPEQLEFDGHTSINI